MAAAGLFETLELMHDVDAGIGSYVTRINETVEHSSGLLRRSVRLEFEVPVITGHLAVESSAPFVFILRAPEKGTLWTIDDVQVDGNPGSRVLGHEEHESYSRALIAARYWSVCARWALEGRTERAIAEHVCAELAEIPRLTAIDARARIESYFTSTGRVRLLDTTMPISSFERRLYRLCQFLADRYLVAVAIDCEPGEVLTVGYSLDDVIPDVDSEFKTRTTKSSRFRLAVGAAPVPLLFHAPLARMASSYDIKVTMHESVYVHRQGLLQEAEGGSETSFRLIPEDEISGVRTWRRQPGTSISHLYLANGNKRLHPTYVGINVFENLPGSVGRAALLALGGSLVCVLLTIVRIVAGDAMSGDAAAVSVAVLSFLAFGTDALVTNRSTPYVALASRVSQLATALLLFLFTLWLLMPIASDEPYRAGIGLWAPPVLWSAVVVGLGVNSWLTIRRWRSAYRVFYRTVGLEE